MTKQSGSQEIKGRVDFIHFTYNPINPMEIIGEYTTSLKRALKEIDKNYEKYDALVVAGTHNPKDYDIEKIIEKIKEARETRRPFLGICFGHQLAAIEYARGVLDIKDATSEEFGRGTYIVIKRKDLKVGLHEGESYWNNYEVHLPEWKKEASQFTSQAHPEYQSSIDNPHPLLVSFINYAKNYKK